MGYTAVPDTSGGVDGLADYWVRLVGNRAFVRLLGLDFSTFRLVELKWVRLVGSETNPGLFQIRFQYILARG